MLSSIAAFGGLFALLLVAAGIIAANSLTFGLGIGALAVATFALGWARRP